MDAVASYCPEIPFWPQLPKRSFYESMYVQCLERMPALVIDPPSASAYVDTGRTDGIEEFYENVANDNVDAFAISTESAPGFYALLERLPRMSEGIKCVKGQVTGPFTLGIGLKDEKGKPIIYDSAYFDIMKKTLRMKAAWMIREIKRACPGTAVLLFFDEPALVSFGSAFVSVSAEMVSLLFDEMREGLDAKVGVHVCGNTDWPLLLRTGIDVINYDAFNFMETLFYFERELAEFLARGGAIAPGIVPSSGEALGAATADSLARLWHSWERLLAGAGRQPDQAVIVTTSCGLGTLSEAEAYRALELLKELPAAI